MLDKSTGNTKTNNANTTKQIQRIERMEGILKEQTKVSEEFKHALEKFAEGQQAYQELKEYYISDEYMQDVDADEAGILPEDLPRGVLSEDLVYDLIFENHLISIQMLELATDMIKNH